MDFLEPCGSIAPSGRDQRYQRKSGSDPAKQSDSRTPAERDRGRVAYSEYLRRLSGVSQVVTPSAHAARRHTRESHSQKVSLIAREIAEDLTRRISRNSGELELLASLGGLCVPACETAGLAHDFGHPPYGHAGEVELNRLLRLRGVDDGFEGNAQSFRILTRLARRRPTEGVLGLDLTTITLASVLKYPRMCPPELQVGGAKDTQAAIRPPKFGAYLEDREYFKFAMEHLGSIESQTGRKLPRTVEASVMDIADDIAYAFHDLEDLYKEGIIDFDAVLTDLQGAAKSLAKYDAIEKSDNTFIQAAARLEQDLTERFDLHMYRKALRTTESLIRDAQLTTQYDGSTFTGGMLTMALSQAMGPLFASIQLDGEDPRGPVVLSGQSWYDLQPLKTITRTYVIDRAGMGQLEFAQRRVIRGMFEALESWLDEKPAVTLLPEPLRSFLLEIPGVVHEGEVVEPNSKEVKRAIADYICTLSDEETLDRFHWLTATKLPSLRPSL